MKPYPQDPYCVKPQLDGTDHPLQSPAVADRMPARFGIVQRDIAVIYCLIIATAGGSLVWSQTVSSVLLQVLVFVPAGFLVGVGFHSLFLLQHEAAHFNLAAGRKMNDLVANSLISYWFFQDIKSYRRMHWDHHLKHGQTDDPENSYQYPLSKKYLWNAFIGVTLFRKILSWEEKGRPKKNPEKNFTPLMMFALYQGLVFFIFLKWNAWLAYATVWVWPLISWFPLLAVVRQVCEHRKPDAREEVYKDIDHGTYTRLFEGGLIAYFMGGAGFRLHWYHHFNPYISYTRLDEFEQEVQGQFPELKDTLVKSSYLKTFRQLLRDANVY